MVGGPWLIDHWTRGQEIKLVPNHAYWGAKPNLDAVVWKIIPDAASALAAYKSGQVAMVRTVPPQVTGAELRNIPDTKADVTLGLGLTFLVFNTANPPLDAVTVRQALVYATANPPLDAVTVRQALVYATANLPLDAVTVRQALVYATDRDALVAQVLGPLLTGVRPVHSFMTPAYGRWYGEPYAKYRRDLAKVDQLMTGAGWGRGADAVWVKGDQRASVELQGTAGNKNDELTEQILQSQWKQAGFEVKPNNTTGNAAADSQRKGNFQAAIANGGFTTNDPSRCAVLCSRNIPTAANGFSGQNVQRIADPALDAAWDRVNIEVDDAKRSMPCARPASSWPTTCPSFAPVERYCWRASPERRPRSRGEGPAGSLAPGLQVLVYNTARLAGPIRNNVGILGPFFDLNEWYCKGGRC